jgi:UDP-N-acetylglucosamine 2-epimerase (non-hydrolysing)/GDP/UDP-N,N'-diacetylbacillosamine 2-epimerase (hydrolysing)
LFDDCFRRQAQISPNPYWRGGAGIRVAAVLAEVPMDAKLLRKKMTLRGEVRDGWFR